MIWIKFMSMIFIYRFCISFICFKVWKSKCKYFFSKPKKFVKILFIWDVSKQVNKIKGVTRDFSSHAPVKITAALDEPSSQHAISLRCHSISCVLSIFLFICLMSLRYSVDKCRRHSLENSNIQNVLDSHG